MKIYIYDNTTFEFIKAEEAKIDPEVSKHLGRPIYTLPANATKVPVPELKENESAIFDKETSTWEVISTEMEYAELSETAQQLQNKKNLMKYHLRIEEINAKYDEFLNNPVEYKGFKYLPRYADTYKSLLNKVFPITIWDCEGKVSKEVSLKELTDIANYLDGICETAYQARKVALQKCNVEIAKLMGE